MKEEIIKLSKNLGFDLIGFTDLKCDDYIKHKYELQEILDYKCSFQIGDITDKLLTNEKYSSFNTAIVVAISYPKIETSLVHLSSCSHGIDYHKVIKEKLKVIKYFLTSKNYKSSIYVDNNPLDERYLAYKAGLGFYGKNNLLINEKLGSFFFIGVILTDLICIVDKPIKGKCTSCNLCIKACPTKAISSKGIHNSKKCLSYITQKKNITEYEEKLINNCIYGCDICINICPYNKNIRSNNFKPLNNEIINTKDFLNMSKEEFNSLYKDNSCFWRGKEVLDRNIICYEKNNLNK